MLAMVNARRHLKAQVYGGTANSIVLSSPLRSAASAAPVRPPSPPRRAALSGPQERVQVSVYREVSTDVVSGVALARRGG